MPTRREFITHSAAIGLTTVSAAGQAAADKKSADIPKQSDPTAFAGLRARLHQPGPLYYAQTMFPDPNVSAILGLCGFDYIMIDAEHGLFTLPTLGACTEAIRATNTAVIVRTASHSEIEIKQVLDLGVDGVLVPRVESAAEAAAVVRAARYAPEGIRGVSAAVRAAKFGIDESYVATANSRVAVMAIIESGRGVENVEQIAATPGLDGIVVGGDDLSTDIGLNRQTDHPRYRDAIEKIIRATFAAKLKVGSRAPRTPQERDSMLLHCINDAVGLRLAAQQGLAARRAAVAAL